MIVWPWKRFFIASIVRSFVTAVVVASFWGIWRIFAQVPVLDVGGFLRQWSPWNFNLSMLFSRWFDVLWIIPYAIMETIFSSGRLEEEEPMDASWWTKAFVGVSFLAGIFIGFGPGIAVGFISTIAVAMIIVIGYIIKGLITAFLLIIIFICSGLRWFFEKTLAALHQKERFEKFSRYITGQDLVEEKNTRESKAWAKEQEENRKQRRLTESLVEKNKS